MTRRTKTEGIVLRKKILIDKNSVVVFLTRDFGKIKVFAKGVRNITSRRLPHIQTGNLVKITIYNKKDDLRYLQETSLVSAFSRIKEDMKKINVMYFVFFVLDQLIPESQNEEKIYIMTRNFLVDLAREKTSQSSVNKYLNSLMTYLGYVKEDKSFPELRRLIEELINKKVPSLVI